MVTATSDYLKPISFLIVDDKAYMRRVIKHVLETLGAKTIDEAQDGSEALAAIRNWPPDIILTEWRLYPASGLELLKAIRKERGTVKFTPLIMVTSETRREKVIQARNVGVTEFVAKPFNAKSLLLRIKEVIERPRPFVDVGGYFGPDRRRRSEIMAEGADRRGSGPREPAPAQEKGPRGMTQEQIDRLVAGDNIREN
jgi:two-component system chemotaxis response regulator CheY